MINPLFVICLIIGITPWTTLINPKEQNRKLALLIWQFLGVIGLIVNLIIHS